MYSVSVLGVVFLTRHHLLISCANEGFDLPYMMFMMSASVIHFHRILFLNLA